MGYPGNEAEKAERYCVEKCVAVARAMQATMDVTDVNTGTMCAEPKGAEITRGDMFQERLKALGFVVTPIRPSVVTTLEERIEVVLSEAERHYVDEIVDSGLNGATRGEVIRDAVRQLIQGKVADELISMQSFNKDRGNNKKKK